MNNKRIVLPENSFWKVFKRFGKDEMISMVFNVIGSIIIFKVLKRHYADTDPFFLFLVSIAGPIIEKVGFYPAHFYDAYKKYKRQTVNKYRHYLKKAIKDGSVSLLEDILIHDPVYIILMYTGLKMYSATPVWMLSLLSFVIAVIVVSFLEVYFFEFWYKIFTKRLVKKGYYKETYYETRFIINNSYNLGNTVENLQTIFNLHEVNEDISYVDVYYDNKLLEFNGRTPNLRKRNTYKSSNRNKETFEIIYSKSGELKQTDLSQYRFFINKREKFSIPSQLKDNKKYHESLKIDNLNKNRVIFERNVYRNPDGLFLTHDNVNDEYSVIELKVFKDKLLLIDAMKCLMNNCNLTLTTHGKNVL